MPTVPTPVRPSESNMMCGVTIPAAGVTSLLDRVQAIECRTARLEARLGGKLGAAIAELEFYGLSIRIINNLENHGDIIWLRELLEWSDDDLLNMSNIGLAGLRQIHRAVADFLAGSEVRGEASWIRADWRHALKEKSLPKFEGKDR